MSKDSFDEEIAFRTVEFEMKTKADFNYNFPAILSFQSFQKGFEFITTLDVDRNFSINKIVCIDCTKRKVKTKFINYINNYNQKLLNE